MSITKESATTGRVAEIDTLHPTSEAQLGRTLHEVSDADKSNAVTSDDGSHPLTNHDQVRGIDKELLDVPSTAAATDKLVDGGKTADPRAA